MTDNPATPLTPGFAAAQESEGEPFIIYRMADSYPIGEISEANLAEFVAALYAPLPATAVEAAKLAQQDLIRDVRIPWEEVIGKHMEAYAAEQTCLLREALELARKRIDYLGAVHPDVKHSLANARDFFPRIDTALAAHDKEKEL